MHAEQKRRSEATIHLAKQAFQSTTQPDDESPAGEVSTASDTDA